MGINVKNLLKTAFPFVGTALEMGGLPGQLAANMLGKALGVDKIEATPEAANNAIVAAQTADPDALLKLRQVETDFQLRMQQMGIDSVEKLEALANEDRANARAREIAVKDKTPMFLAIAVTFGFFGILLALLFVAVPKDSQPVLFAMVGSLGTAWIAIVTYYFGSSAGSAANREAMVDTMKTQASNIVEFVKNKAA